MIKPNWSELVLWSCLWVDLLTRIAPIYAIRRRQSKEHELSSASDGFFVDAFECFPLTLVST